jgi:hypothetical protein
MDDRSISITLKERQTLDRETGNTEPQWYTKIPGRTQCTGETPAAALRALAEELERENKRR